MAQAFIQIEARKSPFSPFILVIEVVTVLVLQPELISGNHIGFLINRMIQVSLIEEILVCRHYGWRRTFSKILIIVV
jgi:hypothetical protein